MIHHEKTRAPPRINAIRFSGEWLGRTLLIGIVLPLGLAIVLAVEKHQDFGRIPDDERHLAEDTPFDPQRQEAILRASAGTEERIAGFRSREDGRFTEVMMLRPAAEERRFMRTYGLDSLRRKC